MKKLIALILCLLILSVVSVDLVYARGYHGSHHRGYGGHGHGCFIATAVYGDPNHPCVNVLRELRDKRLLTNSVGYYLVDLYYQYSPAVADFIDNHPSTKSLIRIPLDQIVAISYLLL
jgi:hypothetical protein